MYKFETPYKQNRTILQKKKQFVHIADNRRTMFDYKTRISPTVENNISKTIQKVGTNYRLSIEIAGSGNETIRELHLLQLVELEQLVMLTKWLVKGTLI